jgi:polysaccharide pyruvyl transferase WcaK-like protein
MKRLVRRIALYGFLGSGNLGNDASFETVLSWLRSGNRQVDVSCITIAPEQIETRYGVKSIRLAWRFAHVTGARAVGNALKLLARAIDMPRTYRMIGTFDAVVVPGMGVLEETLGVRPWGLPYWLLLTALMCKLRGRRFVLLGVGAEPAANPLTRWMYGATVALAAHVSYRDRASAIAMTADSAGKPAIVVPDLAFAHPEPVQAAPQAGRLVVGVMAYYGFSDDPVRGATVREQYVGSLAKALTELLDDGHQVVLVGGDSKDTDVGHQVNEAVRAARPGLSEDAVVVRELTTFADLSGEMGLAEVVIGSRFHNVICSLRLGRPTVSIGYAGKNHALMQSFGLEEYSQAIKQLDPATLVAQVRTARNEAEMLSAQIRHTAARFALEVETLLEQVIDTELALTGHQPPSPRIRKEMDRCQAG